MTTREGLITQRESDIIDQIVDRVIMLRGSNKFPVLVTSWSREFIKIDLVTLHRPHGALRLDDLLNAPDALFIKEINGICNNIDRQTGTLKNYKLRYAT